MKQVEDLKDLGAERAVISGTANSSDAFLDVDFQIRTQTFTDETNQVIWSCIKHIRYEDVDSKIDLPLIRSTARQLGFEHIVENPDEINYIGKVLGSVVEPSNVRKFAARIRKFEIGRLLYEQLEKAQENVLQINGSEDPQTILAIAQNTIFDFSDLLINDEGECITHVGEGLQEYYEYLINNPRELMGVPTGFHIWDKFIGGQQRKTVNVIGARSGKGKSLLADNAALYICGTAKIPVLYLDTEMALDGHWQRLLANQSNVTMDEIKTGKSGKNEIKNNKVLEAIKYIKDIPYYYVNIAGKPFEETLSFMRRWLIKEVGYNDEGRVNDCVIIYDYLKLMSSTGLSSDMKEYQLLGFQMTGLHNFAVKFDVPILSFVQLNRDGIDKEGVEAISQSDRIVWLASSVSIFKPKSDDEIAESGKHGNMKMIVAKNRYGPINGYNEYINMKFEGQFARITEGPLSSNVPTEPIKKKEFEIEKDENDKQVPFGN